MKIEYSGWNRGELLAAAGDLKAKHPQLRFGQAIYNAAYRLNPAIEKLAGTDVDPFHDDARVEAFLQKIGAQ